MCSIAGIGLLSQGFAKTKAYMQKLCRICGKSFKTLVNRTMYCSEKCRRHKRYYKLKPMIEKVCMKCKEEFDTRRSDKIFCSIKCKGEWFYKGKPYRKTCKECGKEFIIGKSFQFYCTKACYRKAKNKRNKKEYRERKNELS